MRFRKIMAVGALALLSLGGTAAADITVSQSNDPTLAIAGQMASLIGTEQATLRAMPQANLASLASGPEAAAPAATVAAPKAPLWARKGRAPAETAAPIRHDLAWLAAQPAPKGDAEWNCLRTAVYFEARGETLPGQFAVAEVVLNRRDSGLYPRSVCGVVNQGASAGCQFSFRCDGASDTLRDPVAADIAGRIARVMLDGAPRVLTDGATHFHTRAVRPGWAHRFPRTAAIGAHLFYRQP